MGLEVSPRERERKARFPTIPGHEIGGSTRRTTSPARTSSEIGQPGRWPFKRGPYPTMYRCRFWTARQFAGFGTPDETNARFRYLLEHGQTGLSKAFDVPTLMGLDSDHPRSLGESAARGWRSTA